MIFELGLLKAIKSKMASAHSSRNFHLTTDGSAVGKKQRLHLLVDVGKAIFGVWCNFVEGKRTIRFFPYVRCKEAGASEVAIQKPVVNSHC